MKRFFIVTLLFSLMFSSLAFKADASSRVEDAIALDITERLENIKELRGSIRSLKLQMRTLDIALAEAQKKKSRKKLWTNTKKISDAVTAFTILSGAIAAYHYENKINILKVATFIGGLSSSVSVITGLLSEMSTDEAEIISAKLDELKPILKATETNLLLETKYLCEKEPSNQMCR